MLKGLQSHAKGNDNILCNDEKEYYSVTFAPQPVSSDDIEVSEGSSNGAKQQSNRHSLRSEKHSASFGRNHHYRTVMHLGSNVYGSIEGKMAFVDGSIRKAVFERRFPSLEAEERQVSPDISRVPSPRLSSPNSASSMIGLDGLASSMAEVCALTGSNNTVHSSVQQNTPLISSCCMPLASINNCATPAQTSMVAPFTGLKSSPLSFLLPEKVNDITFISSNGGKVSCTERKYQHHPAQVGI
ncbi:hypothetical protein IFM89_003409 [Coptis chinensis]|uniref:Ribulose-1,5-bisphosphate carboxylase small subunit N-terminal domain-containing protein n=1 Tax=Coptis chinensis TaxID=261450 RepID=A0A835LAR2_9MAGN|nr:hypothetical protein IFM89_003409 [Coptis chinensis]